MATESGTPRFELAHDPGPPSSPRRRARASVATYFNWFARLMGWLWGDLAMFAVVTLTGHWTQSMPLRYMISSTIVAIGSFTIFGWPQLRLWRLQRSRAELRGAELLDGPRTAWALSLLERGGVALFVAASAVEGPLLVGWYAGRINHPRQLRLTWASAWVLGLFWTAIYLTFSVWALITVLAAMCSVFVLQLLRGWRSRRCS